MAFALRNSVPFTILWEFNTYLPLPLCPGAPTLSAVHMKIHSCGTACDEKGMELFFLCPHTCAFQNLQSSVRSSPRSNSHFPWKVAALTLITPCLWLGFSNFCHIPVETRKQNAAEQSACGDIRNYTASEADMSYPPS